MIAWLLYTLHDILRILSFSWFHLNKCLMLLNGSMRGVPSRKDFLVAVSTWTVLYFFASITIYDIFMISSIIICYFRYNTWLCSSVGRSAGGDWIISRLVIFSDLITHLKYVFSRPFWNLWVITGGIIPKPQAVWPK